MPIEPTTARQLDHRLASEQSDRRLPSVAAGLVRAGELVWSGAVGTLSGRADGDPATTDTQYRMGSITKTFVGVEVLRLRDEGRFELNDAISSHLDDTADTGFGGVTIAQLLSHTSGLRAETSGPWWERTPGGSWTDLLASRPALRFRPGARFHYSNVGYAVLGELVGRLRGMPWDQAVRANLLEPLGMPRTSTRPERAVRARLGRAPAGRPAPRRARARRGDDGPGRTAVVDRGGPRPLGCLPRR